MTTNDGTTKYSSDVPKLIPREPLSKEVIQAIEDELNMMFVHSDQLSDLVRGHYEEFVRSMRIEGLPGWGNLGLSGRARFAKWLVGLVGEVKGCRS